MAKGQKKTPRPSPGVLGSAGRTRTCDQSVNSRPLYQLSYRGPRSKPSTRLAKASLFFKYAEAGEERARLAEIARRLAAVPGVERGAGGGARAAVGAARAIRARVRGVLAP